MDLKGYYRRVRAIEETLAESDVVLSSLATTVGGREGVLTEASREVAAKLIAEGRAQVATREETAKFREDQRRAKDKADREEAARRVQIVVLPAAEPVAAPQTQEKEKRG